MGDHISAPDSSKRKDLDSEGKTFSGDAKKQKKSKKDKKDRIRYDPIDVQDLNESETSTPPIAQDESKNNSCAAGVLTPRLVTSVITTPSISGSGSVQSQVIPLPTAPKEVARSVLAFGLLPRQVAKRPASKLRIQAPIASATGTPPTPSTTGTKFRARDIMAQINTTVPPSPKDTVTQVTSSLPPVTEPIAIVTSISTLIKAEPLFVKPANNPKRYEFPYGNYPNYYEKRIQEQTKRRNPTLSVSTTSRSNGDARKTVEVWDKVWENQTEEGYHQRKHFRLSATPTVLFPAGCVSYSSKSGSGLQKRSTRLKEIKMTLVNLAKKVDLRLEFLDPTWFRGKRVLDIGCNSGLLTVFIALHYKPNKIQGVDIDASLIGKAQKFVLKTFSQLSTDAYTQTISGSSLISTSPTATQDASSNTVEDVPYEEYFPKAMQKIHGTLPIPKRTGRTEHLFPHNIELRVADWITEPEDLKDAKKHLPQPEQWDAIIGFSLTKWIHLHHGDEGLKKFFHKVYRNLTPGGVFLVEPQDYATYAKRSKITPEMKKTYGGLKFRPEEFRDYLVNEVGFREFQHLGQSDGRAKNFNRDIFLFRK
ncbi:hypothetical protein BGZ95_003944 [Linnemannia exigua]|uniref:RNA methyltransferase n=1 Tax=Linnemannia exigua TaxID=604196 RepID=A0AAD4D3K2_9FUNG|nr:hypothetical protein BGZ95_003944 [Linnemannia exigua]